MSFRYVNPGYAEFVDVANFTPNDPVNTVVNNVYSNSGVSFSRLNGNWTNAKFPIKEGFVDNFYMKFDVFYALSEGFRITASTSNVIDNLSWTYGFVCSSGDCCFRKGGSRVGKSQALSLNAINTVWFHVYTNGTYDSSSDSFFEMIINDNEKIITNFDYAYFFNSKDKQVIISVANGLYFSNIIISDEYISPKEEVIMLPTSSVVTDMTDNQDGTYTADEAGQTILQTVDATSLITQYGGKSKVTSIGSIGVPAYKTATGLSNLVGIDKISGTITEHDSIALSTNSTLGAIDVWNTNITIEALNGKQIGWKAAT